MPGLSLTLNEKEEIVIGDPERPIAVVRVSKIKDERVLLNTLANRGIPIHRREIADRIIAERRATDGARTATG